MNLIYALLILRIICLFSIPGHADFLIFEKKTSGRDKNFSAEKNAYGENIWNVYRYDPDGDDNRKVDEYLENYLFKNLDIINYSGLLYDVIGKNLIDNENLSKFNEKYLSNDITRLTKK